MPNPEQSPPIGGGEEGGGGARGKRRKEDDSALVPGQATPLGPGVSSRPLLLAGAAELNGLVNVPLHPSLALHVSEVLGMDLGVLYNQLVTVWCVCSAAMPTPFHTPPSSPSSPSPPPPPPPPPLHTIARIGGWVGTYLLACLHIFCAYPLGRSRSWVDEGLMMVVRMGA